MNGPQGLAFSGKLLTCLPTEDWMERDLGSHKVQSRELFQLQPGEGGPQEKAVFARGLTGEEGSRPVPGLWQGMKGSLTKSLMSPITLWYFPRRLPTSALPPFPARSQALPLSGSLAGWPSLG